MKPTPEEIARAEYWETRIAEQIANPSCPPANDTDPFSRAWNAWVRGGMKGPSPLEDPNLSK
jgi:hypothetical protein